VGILWNGNKEDYFGWIFLVQLWILEDPSFSADIFQNHFIDLSKVWIMILVITIKLPRDHFLKEIVHKLHTIIAVQTNINYGHLGKD
jgi:hypothetical protein